MKKIIFFAYTFVIGNALSADFFNIGVTDLFKKREPYTCDCISNRFESEDYCIKKEISKDQFVKKYEEFKAYEEALKLEEEMNKEIACEVCDNELEGDKLPSASEEIAELSSTFNDVKEWKESSEKQLEDIVIEKNPLGRGGWRNLPGNDSSKAWCKVFQTLANRKVKLSEIKFNEEKARKEKEEKSRIAKEKEEEKARIAKKKKNRDNSGKYGVSFNMTKNDLPNYCETKYQITNFGTSYKKRVFCDSEDRKFEVQFGQNFVDVIKRNMGEYSLSEFNKIVKTLNNRYKLIKKPSMADEEKFFLADYGKVYFFENESGFDSSAGVFDKKRGPKYIEFSVTTEKNYDVIMYLYYYSTHHFEENILPRINKEKNKLNDI